MMMGDDGMMCCDGILGRGQSSKYDSLPRLANDVCGPTGKSWLETIFFSLSIVK